MSNFTSTEHWKHFADFCRWEQATGGPDPQIPLVGEMARDCSMNERIWRGGCYIAVYNVPFAEILWREWSWEHVQANPEDLLPWLTDVWPGIITRFERRCVRRPEWMAKFLLGYAQWQKVLLDSGSLPPTSSEERYLVMWDSCLTVPRLGRYVALKLLEYLDKHCDFSLRAPDIRPKGGWSPRETLAELFPKHNELINGGDKPENHQIINKCCHTAIERLRDAYNVAVDYFQLQVLLCEYRESHESKKQYPGRSHDSELNYGNKAAALWPDAKTDLWRARSALFPQACLGEISGWDGPRKDLGRVLATHGYTWSDLKFDYHRTAAAGFELPVPWRIKPRVRPQ